MNRWRPLGQMVLARLREFYREPVAIFWVYGFPLLLAVVLGLAFSGGAPEPPVVDVENVGDEKLVQSVVEPLKAAKHKVEVHPMEECKARLRIGKTALIVIPGADRVSYRYDPNRTDSVLARHWADEVLTRARAGSTVPEAVEQPVTDLGGAGIELKGLRLVRVVDDLHLPADRRALSDVVDDVDPGPRVVLAGDGRLQQTNADRSRWRRSCLCEGRDGRDECPGRQQQDENKGALVHGWLALMRWTV